MIEDAPVLDPEKFGEAAELLLNPDLSPVFSKIEREYLYWDKVKYLAPAGIQPKMLWQAVKMQRFGNARELVFGKYRFRFTVTSFMQELLHEFDMNFGGYLGPESIIPEANQHVFLISSLMEEAIASSQMEGASTTRRVAKDMLRKQLKPKDKSQQMIVNNYSTIKYLIEHKSEKFSVDKILEIHRYITSRTLDNPEDEGRFRSDDSICVMNGMTGDVAHTPPSFSEVPELIRLLCGFADQENHENFIHPIIKGIIIHFLLAYIHPFVDGNGRTARSLVYWYLLQKGYWITEYLSISRIIYKNKNQYEKAFLYTEHDGLDLSYFIYYNLVTMKKAYIELKEYLGRKIRQQNSLLQFRKVEGINERQAQILSWFIDTPSSVFTAGELAVRFAVSSKTARSDLNWLVERGYLNEISLNKRKIGYVRSEKFQEILGK